MTGGSGNRGNPLTKVTSKQLPPIYDKLIIYDPMSVRMQAGIRGILITPRFRELLGDGHQLGVRFSYAVQPSPDGLARVFIIGADFIGDDCAAEVPPARAVLWPMAPLCTAAARTRRSKMPFGFECCARGSPWEDAALTETGSAEYLKKFTFYQRQNLSIFV